MLRVFHHYFSARKLIFFVAEGTAIALACLAGAYAMSAAVAPVGTDVIAQRLIPVSLFLAIGLGAAFQLALYAFDLYDFRVAGEDRTRGTRILKAMGVAALVAA